jgi:prophage regulatory protein
MQRNATETQPHTSEPTPLFARMNTVRRLTGLGRSTIYRMIANKEFPEQVQIGPRAVGWRWTDLERWSEARPTISH